MNFNTNTNNEQEWLTPIDIIMALGSFDLDPCAPPPERRPWATAERHYSKEEDGDGLCLPWRGRVWLNPPYSRETFKWLARLAEHGSGIALTFARTETNGFHAEVWEKAYCVFFFRGRLSFGLSGSGEIKDRCNAPSCLIAYSLEDSEAIAMAAAANLIQGKIVWLKPPAGGDR